jgi:cyclopropane fatty-acyl-phospholipid synthase-like methyltransferase
MASEENKKCAALYSSVSSAQFKTGCNFIATLDVKPRDKVLDMGCGTGELAKYMEKLEILV